MDNSLFGSLFQTDWARKGDALFQKGYLDKAAEAYLKAGRLEQAAQLLGQVKQVDRAVEVYREAGLDRQAAELLTAEGRHRDAAAVYESAGMLPAAADAYLAARVWSRAARLYEQAEMYRQAAEAFAKGNEIELAVGAWELEAGRLKRQRGSSPDRALENRIRQLDLHRAEILATLGRYGEAGALFAEHGAKDRAGGLLARGEQYAASAQAYFDAGLLQQAIEAIGHAGPDADELRAQIFLAAGRHGDAGLILERLGRPLEAAEAYETVRDWGRAAGAYQAAEELDRAADLYTRAGRDADAARCYAQADRHVQAAEAFARAGLPQPAADAYIAAGRNLEAGELYAAAGAETAAREALRRVEKGDRGWGRATRLLIPLLIEEGLLEGAQAKLEELIRSGDPIEDKERFYLEARVAEARGHAREAVVLYERVQKMVAGFRDTTRRLTAVQRTIAAVDRELAATPPEPASARKSEPRRPSPTPTPRPADMASAVTTVTPVARKAKKPAAETPKPAAEPIVEAGPVQTVSIPAIPDETLAGVPRPASVAVSDVDTAELPFTITAPIEPWWDGADFARAVDQRSGKPALLVAVPVASLGKRLDDLRRGARQAVALRHTGILALEEVIVTPSQVILLHEEFPGRPLASVLMERRLSPLAGLNLLVQLCDALTAGHKMAMTHQWLSPRTILIDDASRVKLVGFGLGSLVVGDPTTRAYLSPEVREGGIIGLTADVFSLGLLAVELLQAGLPVDWADKPQVDARRVTWPAAVDEVVPQTVRDAIVRSLARDPYERPSAEELKRSVTSVGLLPGQILAHRYEILAELGRGGMSRVYRARDRDLDDEVAIKTVITPQAGHSEDAERLLQEVRICRKITHPNVVRVHDFGRFPGGIFVIMELLDGPGLDDVLRDESPLALGRIRSILLEIAGALAEAHRLKIIHRDLKPGNVMVTGGRVKVMDFGIARMGDSSNLTQTGQVVGSPKYMAPEQIQGLPLAGTCDLYALGVIAYTLIAGREPFLGETTTSVVLKHLHEPVPDIRQYRANLPGPWIDFLAKLLEKRPEDRYQTAEETAEVLAGLPDG